MHLSTSRTNLAIMARLLSRASRSGQSDAPSAKSLCPFPISQSVAAASRFPFQRFVFFLRNLQFVFHCIIAFQKDLLLGKQPFKNLRQTFSHSEPNFTKVRIIFQFINTFPKNICGHSPKSFINHDFVKPLLIFLDEIAK